MWLRPSSLHHTIMSKACYDEFELYLPEHKVSNTSNETVQIDLEHDLALGVILHLFDVSNWYNPSMSNLVVPFKFFSTLEQYISSYDKASYLFARHDALSAKDVMMPPIFERSIAGYEQCIGINSISPRVREAIRLNTIADPNYQPNIYVARPIIPIEMEFRALVVNGITKWIIPDYADRTIDTNYQQYSDVYNICKQFIKLQPFDNLCIDVVITNGNALVLECNPLLHQHTDIYPYSEFVDLRDLSTPGNAECFY